MNLQILRNQPDNIYEFGAKYFEDLIEENKRAAERESSPEVAADEGGGAEAGWWNMGDEETAPFTAMPLQSLASRLADSDSNVCASGSTDTRRPELLCRRLIAHETVPKRAPSSRTTE